MGWMKETVQNGTKPKCAHQQFSEKTRSLTVSLLAIAMWD